MKNNKPMFLLGAIAGDVIGSVFEFSPHKDTNFPLFTETSRLTDDSILTLAVADALVRKRGYHECILEYARAYPDSGYGGKFSAWMRSPDPLPYNSYGNGSAMRVSPIGWAFDTIPDVLAQAELSAAVTHNHPEGIKGAQAVALAILLARRGENKRTIRTEICTRFCYDLSSTLDEIRPGYSFDETCQRTVPQAITTFLESNGVEDTIRNAVSLGGDADTLAAIAGSIAEAYYGGIPEEIVIEIKKRMAPGLWMVIEEFNLAYGRSAWLKQESR